MSDTRVLEVFLKGFSQFPRTKTLDELAITRTQENSYFISHQLGTVTTWLDSDGVVIVNNCQQHGDWAANGSVVTVLPAVNNGDYTVTVQSLCSHWV